MSKLSNDLSDENNEKDHENRIRPEPKRGLFKIITIAVIILIIIGFIAHIVLVYLAASSLELKNEEFNRIKALSLTDYEVTFTLTLENPTSTNIEIEKITYNIYVEEEYLGFGEKTLFSIEPGTKKYTFTFQFSIYDLSDSVRQLFLQSSATLKITGEVTVPVKFFGVWKFMEVTTPYELYEEISVS